MLALIASRLPRPADEAVDRDPGIITLAFAVARAVRGAAATAFGRHCALIREMGGPAPF